MKNSLRHKFYDDPEYKKKQASITHTYWKLGIFNFKTKSLVIRFCKNSECNKSFQVKPYDSKIFCSQSCVAYVTNKKRIVSIETRLKHSLYMKSRPDLYRDNQRGLRMVTYKTIICQNPTCQKAISLPPYLAKTRRYCSVVCAIRVIGRKTTSPKASKGKPGIRPDIDNAICFYSTWEANLARVFNLINLTWQYAPRIFDLGAHTYRPDFYLPEDNTYIEVKNFMNTYSFNRDRLFREKYPYIKLTLISKREYKEIEENYRPFIDSWEK